MIRLASLSQETGCEVLAKCEFLNPGGSGKDRVALACVEAAERSGALQPGGMLVEGTSGSTGISLALLARARGYGCTIFLPNDQATEKAALLRRLGAAARRHSLWVSLGGVPEAAPDAPQAGGFEQAVGAARNGGAATGSADALGALTAYELEREAQIKRNSAKLAALKLPVLAPPASPRAGKRKAVRRPRAVPKPHITKPCG
jgi:cysteine synthase